MKTILTIQELNDFLKSETGQGSRSVLVIEDNKSSIVLQHLVVEHPISFIRNIQEFSKNFNIPVSDISVKLIGFVLPDYRLIQSSDVFEISPYVYFKKAEEAEVPKDN